MDFNALCRCLADTLNPDDNARKAAERTLKELSVVPGYLTTLTQMCLSPEVPDGGKMAAAIAMKNAIYRNWHDDNPGTPAVYSDAEKESIRGAIVDAAASQTVVPVQNAFVEAVSVIFRHDYPDRWPALPAILAGHLTSRDPHRTVVVSRIIHEMAKVYEWKPSSAQGPMVLLMTSLYPLLTDLMGALQAFHTPEAAKVLNQIMGTYYSLCLHRLESYPMFCSREGIVKWCQLIGAVLVKELPEPGEPGEPAGMPVSLDARPAWPWWKAKKRAMKIFYNFADRYGQPQIVEDDGSPALLEVAKIFNKDIAPVVAHSALTMLQRWRGSGRYMPPRMLAYVASYLQICVDYSSCWKVLKPHVGFLAADAIPAILRLTPAELESWVSDPMDFLRTVDDPMEEYLHPRNAGMLLMAALLTHRGKACVPIIVEAMSKGFAAYRSAAVTGAISLTAPYGSPGDALYKDSLMQMLEGMYPYVEENAKSAVGKSIEKVLVDHIVPEFRSPFPQLRSRAITTWRTYAAWRFKDKTLAPNGVLAVVQAMDDRDDVVRFTAGGNLSHLIVGVEEARSVLQPHIPALLSKLFGMLGDLGMDSVVSTVQSIVETFGDQMVQLAGPVLNTLMRIFEQLLSEPGEDGDLEDEAALAAEGIISAIESVVAILDNQESDAPILSVLPMLWSFIDKVLGAGPSAVEFLEAALSLLGQCIEAAGPERLPTTPEPFVLLLKAIEFVRESALDYIQSLAYPLDALMSLCPSRFAAPLDPATGQDTVKVLVELAELVEARQGEYERGKMTRSLITCLHWCRGLVDRALPSIIRLYAPPIANGHTQFLRSQTAAVVFGACFMYNPGLALAALVEDEARAAAALKGLVHAAMEGFFKRSLDCKLVLLGLSALLRIPMASLPPVVASVVPHLLTTVALLEERGRELLVLEAMKRKEFEELEAEMDAEEGGGGFDDDDFDFDDEDDDGDGPALGDDDEADVISPADQAHKEKLARMKAEAAAAAEKGGAGGAGERPAAIPAGDDPDAWSHAPPPDSPVDHICALLHLADAFMAVMGQPEAPAVQAALPPDAVARLQALFTRAQEERAKGTQAGEFGPAPEDAVPVVRVG